MPEERQTFVLVMRDTAFWIIGPFADDDAVQDWGDYEYNHGDDPRWQTISLLPSEVSENLVVVVRSIDFHPPVFESADNRNA